LSNLTSPTALNQPLNFSTPTNAGNAYVNYGMLGTNATGVYGSGVVDQTSGFIINTGSGYSGAFNSTIDDIMILGPNCNLGGGRISTTWAAYCDQWEGNYQTAGVGTNTLEHHWTMWPTNGSNQRIMMSQFAYADGHDNFFKWSLNSGFTFNYNTGDLTNVTASAAWTSAAGGTFTYTIGSGTWAWDYVAGTAGVTITGCSTSAYNTTAGAFPVIAAGGYQGTTFTLTGVGANPGSSATGCLVQSGRNVQYAALSPGGIVTSGTIPIIAGGNLVANSGATGTGAAPVGLQLLGGQNVMLTAISSPPSLCPGLLSPTAGVFYYPNASAIPYYCASGSSAAPVPMSTPFANAAGIYAYNDGGHAGIRFYPTTGVDKYVFPNSYTSDTNWTGLYIEPITNDDYIITSSTDVLTLYTGSDIVIAPNYTTAETCAASTTICTFVNSPLMPTPTSSDSSTKGATTAFVKNQGYAGAIPTPSGTATFTAGTNVTSVVCATSYTCTNTRGELTIVGGTATTGTIATVNFSATLSAAPGLCLVTQEGGASVFGVGHGVPSTTSFTITSSVSVAASTVTIDYQCLP
jgi:hypothetical protein